MLVLSIYLFVAIKEATNIDDLFQMHDELFHLEDHDLRPENINLSRYVFTVLCIVFWPLAYALEIFFNLTNES